MAAVDVVITCHDYERYVREAIHSVLAQTYRDFTLTIVDDGSTDGSLEIAREYEPMERVSVVAQPNAGVCAARNNGIAAGEAPYVLTLDADDLIHPEFLARTAPVLDADPSLGFVYTWLVYFGEQDLLIRNPEFDAARLRQENYVNTTSLFRREAWEQAGGFDDSIGGYEDWDFWLSLADRGWSGRLVPEPLFFYRRHGASLVDAHDAERAALETRIRAKHARARDEPPGPSGAA